MTRQLGEIWVYLSASPLLGLTVTLVAYQGAYWLYKRSGFNPLANPVLIAVCALVALLTAAGVPYIIGALVVGGVAAMGVVIWLMLKVMNREKK